MDDVQLNIAGIRDIKMIHMYHILKDDKVLPAMAVHFDRDKIVNLCMTDRHYDELVDKVFAVYEREAKDGRILTDPTTKSMLDRTRESRDEYYVKMSENLTELKEPISYRKSYIAQRVLPAVRYLLDQLYAMSGRKLEWSYEKGWFGTGRLSAVSDGVVKVFPYRVEKDDAEGISIRVTNVLDKTYALMINVLTGRKCIRIDAECKETELKATLIYRIDPADMKVDLSERVDMHGKTVYKNEEEIVGTAADENINSGFNKINMFPDKAYIYDLSWCKVMTSVSSDSGEKVDDTMAAVTYIFDDKEKCLVYALGYEDITDNESGMSFSINNFAMDIHTDKKSGRCEVYCDASDAMSRGTYRDRYAGRYFLLKDSLN